jgi:hypothetical protein
MELHVIAWLIRKLWTFKGSGCRATLSSSWAETVLSSKC